MPRLASLSAQIARLSQYNSQAVSPANPYGLAADGHQSNFPLALADLAAVADAVATEAGIIDVAGETPLLFPWRNVLVDAGFGLAGRGLGPFGGYARMACNWYAGPYATTLVTDVTKMAQGAVRGAQVVVGPNQAGFLPLVIHRLENLVELAATPLMLSVWVHASAASTIELWYEQNFGAGGSASVYNAATYSVPAGLSRISLAWTPPSTAAKVIGTNPYLLVQVARSAQAVGATYVFSAMQMERGGLTPFEARPLGVEREIAGRYFWSSYAPGVAPGAITTDGQLMAQASAAGLMFDCRTGFMRAAPTVTTHRPDAAGNGTGGGASSLVVTVVRADRGGVTITGAAPVAGTIYALHVVASAEL